MKKFPFIIIILFEIPGFLSAQIQNNIWYFGNKAGLDFNTTPPTPIESYLFTLEGTASICDPAGHLLFYTNGATVWDRNHNVMPTGSGLRGGESSTQAALIVPLPNSCSQYYLFTTEDHYTDGGLAYSVVDMCLNNGIGDIVSSSKNTLVVNRTAEKITSVLHANGVDIWILTHTLASNQFLAYLLSATGLNITPVVSSIGSFYSSNAIIGPIKASHNGSKIASSASFYNICEMFDFNSTSGQLTNLFDINQFFNKQHFVYGIEFSPNDSLLYLSTFFVTNYLYQLNLETDQLTTLNSIPGNYHYGAIQMGPDKKIYMARNDSAFVDVIHQPDLPGFACQYDEGGQVLALGTSSRSGLQNFAPYSFFNVGNAILSLGNDTTLCMGDSIILKLNFPSNCEANILWNDGSTDSEKIIKQPGIYWVEVENSCSSFRDTIQIDLTPLPNISFHDTLLCEGETLTLDASIPGATYVWSNSSIESFLNVEEPGTYWVELSNSCSIDTEFIEITIAPSPYISFNDTILCEGEKITLDASFPGVNYLWSNNSTNPSIVLENQGSFWVQLSNSCYTFTDSFYIVLTPLPDISFPDTILCSGESLVLDATFPGATYLWSNGSAGPFLNVEKEGVYWVELSNSCFTVKKFVEISIAPLPYVSFKDTLLCEGETITLDASFPGVIYLWSDNSSNSTIEIENGGVYWVQLSNSCYTFTDSFYIGVTPLPDVSLPDTNLCSGETLVLDATFPGATYLWSDSSNESLLRVEKAGNYWVEITNSCFTTKEFIDITSTFSPDIELEDTVLCEGHHIVLDASFPGSTYLWSDHSTKPTLNVDEEGDYWVEVANECGRDTVLISINSINCDFSVYIPNVFSPNADGYNDGVTPVANTDLAKYEFLIFDRWGNCVFKSNNNQELWDGFFKNKKASMGVYAYRLDCESVLGIVKQFTGNITLIR